MGCNFCKYERQEPVGDLSAAPEEISNNVNNALFSEPMQSGDGPLTHEREPTSQLHNSVKKSRPCHVKLATDRGRARPGSDKATEVSPKNDAWADTEGPARIVVHGADVHPCEYTIKAVAKPKKGESTKARLEVPKSRETMSKPAPKRAAASSTSVAFDPGCVVVEKMGGSIYDTYKVVDVLGRGSFGEVKKVVHRVSGKAYALKIINKSRCAENGNLINEIAILKKIYHPNIVRLYEFAQDSHAFFLITEYCAGGELLNKIMTLKSFSETTAARIMRQLLCAVAYCHARNIVHRDLKPENLVLDSDDIESDVKVIDFGTSRIFKHTEKMRDILGTALYIAPEVIKGNYTEKCDLWSCGVIMYVLLSGGPPFFGGSNEEVMRKVEKGRVSFAGMWDELEERIGPQWTKVSEDAVNFLKRMLTYDPEKRVSAEEALSDIWIVKYTHADRVEAVNVLESMTLLKQFKAESNLQKAVLSYMADHIMSLEQEQKMRQVFEMLDVNGDGQLSKEELLEGYKILLDGQVEEAKREVETTMAQTDLNHNGTLDYKEFLMASIKRTDLINQRKLKQAFDFFDAISKDEMKRIFSLGPCEKVIQAIFRDADLDHDGQISFVEFTGFMSKYVPGTMPTVSTTRSSVLV